MSRGSRDQSSILFLYYIAITTTISITGIITLQRCYSTFKQDLHRSSNSQSFGVYFVSLIEKEYISMWRNVGTKSDEDQDEIEDEEEIESEEEIMRQRDILYSTIIPTSSPHGVPSLIKTLDAAILFLKMARAIDKRLQNSSKIEEFFDYLYTIEQENARTARIGFGNLKVLVIEGLMSSGKSTLINGLKTITRASVITAVPALLLEIKYLFNSADVPETVLTALDCVINYCVAHRITSEAANHPTGMLL